MDIERPTNSNGLALGLAVLNGVGMLTAFVVAAVLFLSVASEPVSGTRGISLALPMLSLGWVSGLVGLVLLIGLVQAVARMGGKSLPAWKGAGSLRPASVALVLVWPAALLGGNALAQDPDQLSLILLPPCLILAVALPAWWLLAFARRGLKTPVHRAWGTAGVVMMASLPLAMLVELFFILIGGMFLMGMISNQPELVNSLNQLTRDISRGQVDLDALVALFEPFLRNPGVVFLLISGLAVVVPLVEEALKPLGLWFLAKRGFSPVQGFVLGATSGAAFALVESLATLSSVSGEGWMGLALGRAGTALLHITCSGLVGWGLGLAWTRAKYAQLAGLFLLAVAVHGAWNGFAQFLGLMPFLNEPALAVQSSGMSEVVIVAVLGIILLATALMLLYINRRLNAEQAQEEAAALAAQPVSPAGELPYVQPPFYPAAPIPPSLPGEGDESVPPAQS